MELNINKFKNELINTINEAELPISLIFYILKDTLVEVEGLRNQELQKQLQEQEEQEKTTEE